MNPTLRNWLIILVVGAAIWFSPIPTGLKPDAWHIFAVFVATVLGFILHPMPIGAIAFISLTFCCFTGLLKTSQVLMGFGNGTIWLIVCAFFLSRAFIKTGFGRRIAYVIIKLIGRSSLTLGYSIALSELVVSPAMPSATARGGGVFYPIVRSLSEAFGSQPGPSSRKIGAYLMQVGYHTDATTCMMFLTSMAGNPLCVGLAASAVGVEITWTNWALAAIVPGLISLALVPWVVSLLSPPEIKAIPNARELAEKELAAMGPMSKDEKVLAFVFVMCLVLWATGSWTHLGATPIAMLAIAIMLIAKVLSWQDILSEKGAYDAMFWMGGLMSLATALGKSGFITIPHPEKQLCVASVQTFLDQYLKEFGGEVDYIHGDEVVDELGSKPGNFGIKLPAMGKEQLFKTVMADGVLPRKTFSMGHAQDKRYYIEARKIR